MSDTPYVPPGLAERLDSEKRARERFAALEKEGKSPLRSVAEPAEMVEVPESVVPPVVPVRVPAPSHTVAREEPMTPAIAIQQFFANLVASAVEIDLGSIVVTVEALGWVENDTLVSFFMRGTTGLRIRNSVGEVLRIRRAKGTGAEIEVLSVGGELLISKEVELRQWVFIKKQALAERIASS